MFIQVVPIQTTANVLHPEAQALILNELARTNSVVYRPILPVFPFDFELVNYHFGST